MKKSFIIFLNIGYWILYLLLLSMFLAMLTAGAAKTSSDKSDLIFNFFKLMSIMTVLPGVLSFYIFYHYIFNHFLSKRKIGLSIVAGLITTFICGTLAFAGLNLLNKGLLFKYNGWKEVLLMIAFMSILCMIHGIIALIIKGFIKWYEEIKLKEMLQQKNFETELALVKSQLNPHFLFNSINNIDVLIEKDSAKASIYLNNLSDMMRFILYETKTDKIPLHTELAYIKKYIELQKLRTANSSFIHYKLNGNIGHQKIAPMLFVPFIENAFKHAVDKRMQKAIEITINIMGNKIDFFCKNSFSSVPIEKLEEGGLGNELIVKRLELLYHDRHTLKLLKGNEEYTVALQIDCS
ncbi:MAG TPA: histidine kinase [Ferruginibacter sp.]|nr:histidine kinase [Ferruginibacter sp.]HRE62809.1 histidine kinase [Ferruginibacter sp.]